MAEVLLVDGHPATLKDLADAADVSVSTLRHYFGDRDEVVKAVLARARDDGDVYLRDHGLPLRDDLVAFLGSMVQGWRHTPLRSLFMGAITSGLDHPSLGPAAVEHVLEPTSQALEARLSRHRDAGALSASLDPRHGALSLLGPVVLALLHQHDLSGSGCRPLDVEAFVGRLVDDFVRAHGPGAG